MFVLIGTKAKAGVLALLTNELLALQAFVQPLGRHDVPHHGHGCQELDRARHLAGDQVRALVRRLGNVAPKNVELLKAETETETGEQELHHMARATHPGQDLRYSSQPDTHSRQPRSLQPAGEIPPPGLRERTPPHPRPAGVQGGDPGHFCGGCTHTRTQPHGPAGKNEALLVVSAQTAYPELRGQEAQVSYHLYFKNDGMKTDKTQTYKKWSQ